MNEPRLLLDEDSICYGCGHFVSESEIGVPVPKEDLVCGGICNCNVPCVNGSMNDYDDPLDPALIKFINSVGAVAKSIKPGEATTIPCNCGGILTIGRAKINGHIHAHCDKCKRDLIQ